jgi:hypothetical protein
MPNPSRVPITQPRVPFLNPETGFVSMPWYLFLLSLSQLTSGSEVSLGDLQKGPPSLTVDEINAIIDKAAGDLTPSQDGLLAQIAELQKQVDALALQVRPELGTMSQLQQANLPWVTFDTTPAGMPTTSPGTLYWDEADGNQTLNLVMAGGLTTQQIGEEQYYRIKADSTITEGQVIMFTGTVGASGALKGAPATGLTASTALYVMGVATENIATNGWGYVTSFGLVRGINTTGGAEAWVDGQILYLDPTVPGGLTKTVPVAPNPKVVVAAVVYAAVNGSLFIRPAFGGKLGDFEGDVNIVSPVNGDLLQYNGTVWQNVTAASVIAGSGGAPVTKTANFTVAAGETWLINNKSGSTCTVTLPTPSASTGRVLHFQNYQAQTLVSASSNVVPLAGGSAGTAILQAVAGANATLVSDGTSWIMTQYDSNNSLELE